MSLPVCLPASLTLGISLEGDEGRLFSLASHLRIGAWYVVFIPETQAYLVKKDELSSILD